MQRLAVIAKLRPGAAEQAAQLVELGPPFDPDEHEIERHLVFLASDMVVFVFEGGRPNSLLAALAGAHEQSVLGQWEPLLEGTPIIAREAYSWVVPSARKLQPSWGE